MISLAGSTPARHRGVDGGQQFVAHLGDHVAVRAAPRAGRSAPTERQCISTHGTFASATSGAMFGSARPPDTSLTIWAPFSSAACATSACMVSMLTVIPCPASSLMTGSTRAVSTRGVDAGGAGPGRLAADVDDGGAFGGQRQAVLDGAVTVEEQPPVGEGVVGDVHDPHDLHACRAHFRKMRSSASDRDALSA